MSQAQKHTNETTHSRFSLCIPFFKRKKPSSHSASTPALAFVPVHVDHKHRLHTLPPTARFHESWWDIGKAWFQYHSTQIRWDIERAIARRLGRRWGA